MADQAVWQRRSCRRQEIERDPLECRAVRARRDVIGRTRQSAVAKNPDRADRLHVPRRRGDPRDAMGDGRRRMGKRRARRGGGAAKDRRVEGSGTRSGAGARTEATAARRGMTVELTQNAASTWKSQIGIAAHPSRRPLRGLLRMRSSLLKHNNLMLRSERRERLEAWAASDSPISHSQY